MKNNLENKMGKSEVVGKSDSIYNPKPFPEPKQGVYNPKPGEEGKPYPNPEGGVYGPKPGKPYPKPNPYAGIDSPNKPEPKSLDELKTKALEESKAQVKFLKDLGDTRELTVGVVVAQPGMHITPQPGVVVVNVPIKPKTY